MRSHGFTVAVTCRRLLGVEKVPGGEMVMIVVPTVAGSNCTVSDESPAWKIAGLFTIVPTAGLELVTSTVTSAWPPRRDCGAATVRKVGSSRTASIVSVRLVAVVVVVRLAPVTGAKLKPDGWTVTVRVR